jgi:hypothetical protein
MREGPAAEGASLREGERSEVPICHAAEYAADLGKIGARSYRALP